MTQKERDKFFRQLADGKTLVSRLLVIEGWRRLIEGNTISKILGEWKVPVIK